MKNEGMKGERERDEDGTLNRSIKSKFEQAIIFEIIIIIIILIIYNYNGNKNNNTKLN